VGAQIEVTLSPATPAERDALLVLMKDNLAGRIERIMIFLKLTWPEFEQLYSSRGEVRTITTQGEAAGQCWIEHRGRELHVHAIFVDADKRGQGIGTQVLRVLEAEFRGEVDLIELGVEQGNVGARSLYLREGFVVEDVLAELGFEIMRKRFQQ